MPRYICLYDCASVYRSEACYILTCSHLYANEIEIRSTFVVVDGLKRKEKLISMENCLVPSSDGVR